MPFNPPVRSWERTFGDDQISPRSPLLASYVWSALGVAAATACFWLLRHYVDKGQASLLYLPLVIACAIRFGFGPAMLGATLSFFFWNFFFLPPFHTFVVADPKDWLSLFVFLLAATTTAGLAARARSQTQQAGAREAEIATLFRASEALSREIQAVSLLDTLAKQALTLCHAAYCQVFRRGDPEGLQRVTHQGSFPTAFEEDAIVQRANAAFLQGQILGFEKGHETSLGVYVPLQAEKSVVGVLHVGRRLDGLPFSAMDERLILTLANHAAVAIAREALAGQAAQAAALREADVLKEALLSLVSHELRTPLAAIKASASGLLQPNSDWEEAARQEALSAINKEADRLTGLVSSLLDLSRLEAGAWQPCKDWCDLAEVAGTALDQLPPAQAARVAVQDTPDLPLVQADYTQIVLVLTNLLENAIKYTPESSPICLEIQPTQNGQDEAASGVTLCVRDFGAGFAPGEEKRLFDRFYRGQRHQGGSIHGTGLGLALCQAVVSAHGGRIWAANAPALEPPGAIFCFFLPKG